MARRYARILFFLREPIGHLGVRSKHVEPTKGEKANRAPFGNRSGSVIDGTSTHDESLCSSREILEQT